MSLDSYLPAGAVKSFCLFRFRRTISIMLNCTRHDTCDFECGEQTVESRKDPNNWIFSCFIACHPPVPLICIRKNSFFSSFFIRFIQKKKSQFPCAGVCAPICMMMSGIKIKLINNSAQRSTPLTTLKSNQYSNKHHQQNKRSFSALLPNGNSFGSVMCAQIWL